MELGVGPFALACSGSNILNLTESICYEACPNGTRLEVPFTDAPTSLCGRQLSFFAIIRYPYIVSCPSSYCATCNSTQCLTCEPSYSLYEGECLSSCPDGMYSDGETCQSNQDD